MKKTLASGPTTLEYPSTIQHKSKNLQHSILKYTCDLLPLIVDNVNETAPIHNETYPNE